MSASLSPLDASMRIFCSLPLALSLADTWRMPFASISNVTSTCGMPQVEVTFDIDANGILHVSAKDKASGKEQKIRIEASSGLSDADIDKMVKQAEANAKEDEARRQEIDTRNQLDGLVYKVEK